MQEENNRVQGNIQEVGHTLVKDVQMANPPSLMDKLDEANLEAWCLAMEKERQETEKRACRIVEQTKLEAEERQLNLLKNQINELLDAHKKANEAPPVWNDMALEETGPAKEMKEMLELLRKEESERKRLEQKEQEERERRELEERKCLEEQKAKEDQE